MFEGLTARLQSVFQRLKGKGVLTERDVDEALREVRLALLEADVNFRVVKDFINRIKERAVGQEVLQSLTPAQQVVKIVYEELVQLMGATQSRLAVASRPPTVIMLVGLQGSGKTTTAAKLANYLAKQGRRPLLVGADVYRPAAIEQLRVLGRQLNIPVSAPAAATELGEQALMAGRLGGRVEDPVDVVRQGLADAWQMARDTVIIDTAGRLHIDQELMDELVRIRKEVAPHEVLLVVDAMTGQDAVNVAERFKETIGIDGIVMTKMDGDARGGAALSVRAVTNCPIKFIGVGEKTDAIEPFHPDRLASRILGMGDVLSLIEKAQAAFDQEKAQQIEKKIRQNQFTLEDFLFQLRQMRKMGPIEEILGMLPGFGQLKQIKGMAVNEKELVKAEAIINSMTPAERRDPSILDASRRQRIARGSGTTVQDVNRLVKDFQQVQQVLKSLNINPKKAKRGPGGKVRRPRIFGF